MLARRDLTLWSVSDVKAGAVPASEPLNEFRAILAWTREFLMREHPDLGREGAVCPFTQLSVDMELFHFASLKAERSQKELESVVDSYRIWFKELLAATSEREATFLTFVLLLDSSGGPATVDVDSLQRALKPSFVSDGLMVGQFHARCEEPGLHNPAFRPLRSPVPLIAIRVMTRFDMPFLMEDPAYLESFRLRFANSIPAAPGALTSRRSRA